MKKLRAKTSDGFNQASRWHRYMKPWFDVAAYQVRIDKLTGLNQRGKSIVQLTWGQDGHEPMFGGIIPRYWTRRQRLPGGKFRYWQPPRWIFEKRLEPEQYKPTWEAQRWTQQDEHGVPVDRGPAPDEYFTFAYLVADHEAEGADGWPACCTRAFYTDKSRCWGRYRPPSEDDLQLIAKGVRQMEADKYRDPYRPLTPAELEEVSAMAGMQAERNAEQMLNMEREMAADFYGLPLSAIPENYGRRASGLIVPN